MHLTTEARTAEPAAPHHRGRIMLGLALSALSAGLATLAFGPAHVWWLVFVAFVPMIVAQHHLLPERWSGAAFAIGIAGYVSGYMYGLLDPSFAWWMRLIPVALVVPLFWWGRADRRFHRDSGYRWFLIATPLVWTAGDFLRSSAPMVASRASLAYALFDRPALIQPVSVTGIAALNLLILATNWTVAAAVLGRLRRPSPPPGRGRLAVVAALAVWVGTSLLMLDDPGPVLRVAAIQPGTAGGDRSELDRNVEQTRDAADDGARLVVWREKTVDFDPRGERGDELRALAEETGAYLAIGYGIDTPQGQRNEATVITPDGEVLAAYGKQHPAMMFADDRTSISAGDFPVHDTPVGRLATIICYDLDFFDTARHMARNGAQIVAVPSWDPAGDATKHYPLLVFRAVENRLTMIKAEARYDSAIIDPHGRILERAVTPAGGRATLVADVPLGTGDSLFVTLGPWFGWTTVAASLALHALTRRRP